MLPSPEVCKEQDAGHNGGYAGNSGAVPGSDECERNRQDHVANQEYSKSQGYHLVLRNLHGSLSPVSVATMMERRHGYDTASIGDE